MGCCLSSSGDMLGEPLVAEDEGAMVKERSQQLFNTGGSQNSGPLLPVPMPHETPLDRLENQLEDAIRQGNQLQRATLLLQIGDLYANQKTVEEVGKGLGYYEQYLDLANDMCNTPNIGQARLCIGSTLGKLGRFEEALVHQRKALALSIQTSK